MKTLKRLVSLTLAVFFTLCFAVSAFATTLSGSHNGYAYVCHANGTSTNAYGKLSYQKTATLKVMDTIYVDRTNGTTANISIEMSDTARSVTNSLSYSAARAIDPTLPSNGFFKRIEYDFKIGNHLIESWYETFNS